MRNVSIASVKSHRRYSKRNPEDKLSYRGEPIFTKNGEPLTSSIIFTMTDREVVDCINAEYQEQPNPLGVMAKPMNQEVCDAIDCLERAGIRVRMTGVKFR